MPVPKKKRSKSKKRIKRACWKAELPNLTACPHCAAQILMHNACPECGTYKGKAVLKVKTKETQKEEV